MRICVLPRRDMLSADFDHAAPFIPPFFFDNILLVMLN